MFRLKPVLSSPYLAPGFYDAALAAGRHRAIIGGRWEETGRIQMEALLQAGLLPAHHLVDIGAGALRLGCKAVRYLEPGHYWATDASLALMMRGWAEEIHPPDRLSVSHLVEDATFAFPNVPSDISHAICFAVFPHLPQSVVSDALIQIAQRFPRLQCLLFTVFLDAGLATIGGPVRQADGVVTHPDRPPYHLGLDALHQMAETAGLSLCVQDRMLPRGQKLIEARPKVAEY